MPTLDWLNRPAAFTTAAQVPYRLLEQVSVHGQAKVASADNLLIQGGTAAGTLFVGAGTWNGGGFRFMRLGATVFDAMCRIHPDVRFATLAAFVWQQETGSAWPTDAAQPGTPYSYDMRAR